MRFAGILAGAISVFSAVCVDVAPAQLAPGYSGISDAPLTASGEEYWFFMRELGGCLARSKRAESVALLRTKIDSTEESQAFGALIRRRGNNVCMRNMVRATVIRSQVRGAVAEGLYRLKPMSAFNGLAPRGLAGPESVRTIHEFADCYVASNFVDARNLLAETRLGTQGEKERVGEMAAGFGPCLPKGREIRIVPTDVRLALAEALYRATRVPTNTGQGSN